jgi:hypothetical protein
MMLIIHLKILEDKNSQMLLSNVVHPRLRAAAGAVLMRHLDGGIQMNNVTEKEVSDGQAEALGLANPIVANEASDSTGAEGGKKRKGPKQPKSKPTAQKNAGDAVPATPAETPDQAATNADDGTQAVKGEPGKPDNDVLTSYPNLAAWPVSCGPAPLPTHILTARALGMGAGTKRELAVAAYLRDDAGQFTLVQVAEALRAVLGGEFNVQRNVANNLQSGGLVKINKATVENGTSYRLELTEKGEAKVKKWLAENEPSQKDRLKSTT